MSRSTSDSFPVAFREKLREGLVCSGTLRCIDSKIATRPNLAGRDFDNLEKLQSH